MNVDITQLNMRYLTPCWNSIIERVAKQDILMEHFIHKDSTTWSQTQKSQYIESIMIRAPLNPIVLHGNPFNHTIIDGLNRISAVIEFVNDNFELCDLRLMHDLEGKKFSDFIRGYQRRLEEMRITIYIIESPGKPELSEIVALNYL